MNILMDENVDARLSPLLRSEGHGVKTVSEKSLTSARDEEILSYAFQENFWILTHDDDFLSIVDRRDKHPTIIFLPQNLVFQQMKKRLKNLETDISNNGKIVFA